MADLINRQDAINAIRRKYNENDSDYPTMYQMGLHDANVIIEELPAVQPTLYGYNIEHLKLIANVLQKENLPPERVVEILTDIGRIVSIVRAEYEETLKKAIGIALM